MVIEFYVADRELQCTEEDADFVRYRDYERLRLAAQKALEALEWNWGGEPLPTLEFEAIGLLKKELEVLNETHST